MNFKKFRDFRFKLNGREGVSGVLCFGEYEFLLFMSPENPEQSEAIENADDVKNMNDMEWFFCVRHSDSKEPVCLECLGGKSIIKMPEVFLSSDIDKIMTDVQNELFVPKYKNGMTVWFNSAGFADEKTLDIRKGTVEFYDKKTGKYHVSTDPHCSFILREYELYENPYPLMEDNIMDILSDDVDEEIIKNGVDWFSKKYNHR